MAGIWGNVRYFSPLIAYKTYRSMHYLQFNPNGHNVLALKSQLGYIQGYGGDVAPPNNRFYAGGELGIARLRYSQRHALWLRANASTVQLDQSRRILRPARS